MAGENEKESALRSLSVRDRALANSIAAGTLRMRGRIDFYLSHFLNQPLAALPAKVLNILRSAAFQMLYFDRVPGYAVVNEAVGLARPVSGGRFCGLVNAVLRRLGREWESVPLPSLESGPAGHIAVSHSHPQWLVERYLTRLGRAETVALLEANNCPAPLVLRVRPRDGDLEGARAGLARDIRAAGYEVRNGEFAPEALVLDSGANPSGLPGYGEGLFYVQDEAAMLIGRLAAPSPGWTCLDLCAAPGGKSTHLAELAGASAAVIAAESAVGRLGTLKKNLVRLGEHRVCLVAADSRLSPFRPVDLVLCDVPCSGTGVMRRKPDLRWRIAPPDLESLPLLQRDILAAAADLVRPGGVLVYGTCSLEPEENRAVVEWFLHLRTDFELEPAGGWVTERVVSEDGYIETLPHRQGVDGAFGARMRRLE